MVKNLPALQETQVQSLGQEDPLEKEIETLFSILDWKIPWTEKLGRLIIIYVYQPDIHTCRFSHTKEESMTYIHPLLYTLSLLDFSSI